MSKKKPADQNFLLYAIWNMIALLVSNSECSDELNPDGVPAVDETQPPEAPVF